MTQRPARRRSRPACGSTVEPASPVGSGVDDRSHGRDGDRRGHRLCGHLAGPVPADRRVAAPRTAVDRPGRTLLGRSGRRWVVPADQVASRAVTRPATRSRCCNAMARCAPTRRGSRSSWPPRTPGRAEDEGTIRLRDGSLSDGHAARVAVVTNSDGQRAARSLGTPSRSANVLTVLKLTLAGVTVLGALLALGLSRWTSGAATATDHEVHPGRGADRGDRRGRSVRRLRRECRFLWNRRRARQACGCVRHDDPGPRRRTAAAAEAGGGRRP